MKYFNMTKCCQSGSTGIKYQLSIFLITKCTLQVRLNAPVNELKQNTKWPEKNPKTDIKKHMCITPLHECISRAKYIQQTREREGECMICIIKICTHTAWIFIPANVSFFAHERDGNKVW